MDWGFLSFLAEPWFVVPWYVAGIIGFFYVAWDVSRHNTPLKVAMKWAWPIIVLFFSVIGLLLYFGTARAPGIAKARNDEEKRHKHMEYEKSTFRRVNGAVIHCVAGDGLGIMTAMVIARATGMSFWEEFWFEYLVGFLFGWFIFQFRSMLMMTGSKARALAMAFRAEFFSMLTVMAGMGIVMGYITPMTVTEQPKPLTYAFWGFGMLGLLIGYVFTWPMNYLMVKVGWKHGMGDMQTGHRKQVKSAPPRYGLMTAMAVLGALALVLPAWLVEVRDGTPVRVSAGASDVVAQPGQVNLGQGLTETLEAAIRQLQREARSPAVHAIDAAHRLVSVASYAVPRGPFGEVMRDIEDARHALHNGHGGKALGLLQTAVERLRGTAPGISTDGFSPSRYRDATVLNEHGVKVGEILRADRHTVEVVLGGMRDLWGFLDLGGEVRRVAVEDIAPGRPQTLGVSLLAIPSARGASVAERTGVRPEPDGLPASRTQVLIR